MEKKTGLQLIEEITNLMEQDLEFSEESLKEISEMKWELDWKFERIVDMIHHYEMLENGTKEIIAEATARKKMFGNKVTQLKWLAQFLMDRSGKSKIENPNFVLSFRKTKSVKIFVPAAVPEDLKKYTFSIDGYDPEVERYFQEEKIPYQKNFDVPKAGMKEYINSLSEEEQKKFEGIAKIVESKSLQIK